MNPRSFMAPDDSAVIITGRPLWSEAMTRWWALTYLNIPVHFADEQLSPVDPGTPRLFRMRPVSELAIGKAMQIKRLGVRVYFEDDDETVTHLRKLVDIPIIHYDANWK